METNFKNQRRHYDRDYASGQGSLSQSGDRYQISRPTGYTWIDRIEAEGLKAVEDRFRTPNRHPEPNARTCQARDPPAARKVWLGSHPAAPDHEEAASQSEPSGTQYRQRDPLSTRTSSQEPTQGPGCIPEPFVWRRLGQTRSGLRTSRVSLRPAIGSIASRSR